MKIPEPMRPLETMQDILTRRKGYKERARHLKANQPGSLRKKIRKACPRCNTGTLKKVSSDKLQCNKCKYSKFWSPTWETYGGRR